MQCKTNVKEAGNHNHAPIKELDLLVRDKIKEVKVKAKSTNQSIDEIFMGRWRSSDDEGAKN